MRLEYSDVMEPHNSSSIYLQSDWKHNNFKENKMSFHNATMKWYCLGDLLHYQNQFGWKCIWYINQPKKRRNSINSINLIWYLHLYSRNWGSKPLELSVKESGNFLFHCTVTSSSRTNRVTQTVQMCIHIPPSLVLILSCDQQLKKWLCQCVYVSEVVSDFEF